MTGLLRAVLWQRLDQPGSERCALSQTDQGWRLTGTVLTVAEDEPALIQYQVDVDPDWRTRNVAVEAAIGTREPVQIRLTADGTGKWQAERQPDTNGDWANLAAVSGLIDIDLAFTPATNTLPLRRLTPATGETIAATAVWLRFPELIIEPLPQTYQRLDTHHYRYESSDGAFTAALEFDDLGLIVAYEGLWRRVATSG